MRVQWGWHRGGGQTRLALRYGNLGTWHSPSLSTKERFASLSHDLRIMLLS